MHEAAPPDAWLPPTAALGPSVQDVVPPAWHFSSSPGAADPHEQVLRQGFKIGTLHLCINDRDGSELLDLPAVHRLPNTPTWFLGLTNLHGAVVPVFDIAEFADCVRALSGRPKPMLLVLGHGEQRAGIVIEGLPRRLRLNDSTRMSAAVLPAALMHCLGATHRVESTEWIELRYEPLLDRLEAELKAANT